MIRILIFLCLLSACNESTPEPGIVDNTRDSFKPPVIPDTSKANPATPENISSDSVRPRAADNPHWKKKKYEGVHFIVIGNEPFWNLEFRNNQSIIFLLADWKKSIEIPVDQSFRPGVKNEINAKDIVLYIIPETCSDGMSDYTYDYTVRVIYKSTPYQGCGISLMP